MMKFKKFLAAGMVSAMMFGVVGTVAPRVSVYAADEIVVPKVTIDYDHFTATIEVGDVVTTGNTAINPDYYCVEVLKAKDSAKASATYYYKADTAGTAVVDLSFLKATKTQYIRVSDLNDPEKSIVVTINPQPAKLKAKYKATETELDKRLALTEGKNAVAATDYEKYDYRTLYSSKWASQENTPTSLKDIDLNLYTVAGTTLIIRKKAENSGTDEKLKAPAGAEIKVKISAAAKSPKTTIDYAKGLVSLPKGAEFQLVGGADKWIAVGDAAVKWSPSEILSKAGETEENAAIKSTKGFAIRVRTAATERKAASNSGFLKVPAAPMLVVGPTNIDWSSTPAPTPQAVPTGTAETVITCKASNASNAEALDGKVTVSQKYDLTDGVSYHFAVEDADFDFSEDGKNWTTVKAGKEHVVYGDANKEQNVYVRRSANKATASLASTAAQFTIMQKRTALTSTTSGTTVTVVVATGANCTITRETAEGSNKGKVKVSNVTSGVNAVEYWDGSRWTALTANAILQDSDASEVYTLIVRAVADTTSDPKKDMSDPLKTTVPVSSN